jgi:AraC family transcriptional regulator
MGRTGKGALGLNAGGVTTYQELRRSIDMVRLHQLAAAPAIDPINLSPDQVTVSSPSARSSQLAVWEQRSPAQERYLPRTSKYNVQIRIASHGQVVQFRAGILDVREACAGEAVICPPYGASYLRNMQPSHDVHIAVPPELLVRARGNAYPVTDPRVKLRNSFGGQDSVLASLAEALLEHLRAGLKAPPGFIDCIGTGIAIHLLGRYAERTTVLRGQLSAAQVALVDDYLHSNMTSRITMEEIAGLLGMSPYRFSRMFHATVGMPPLHYCLRQRMSRARTLIESSRLPIGEIAAGVGFLDLSHFGKTFRKYWGAAPSSLRDHARESIKSPLVAPTSRSPD